MKLLHVDSSILGANSVSREVSAAVVARLRHENPQVEVSHRDLATAPLTHLTLGQLPSDHPAAAMAPSDEISADGRIASQDALDEFLAADIVVIGAPMYNFTIPSQLKAWIDRILTPGKTFQYGPEGVKGLAGDKRVIIVVSRGGVFEAGAPSFMAEHVETYLRTLFAFIGVTAPEVIVAEGISVGQRDAAVAGALQAAKSLSPAAARYAA
jgi:FMN-dependent NADH-azoreductase